jgi:cell division protein FtsQ
MPAALNYADDGAPIPRRTKFTTASRAWWRPRSTFGQILLGATGLIVLCAVIALGVYVRQFLTRDPHFRIPGASSIQSTGLSEVNRNDLLPVFGEDIGRNIFFVPLSQRRKQLEAIPWVQEATVMRFLPDRLSVNIVERTPVAFVRQGSQVELADADGVILSMPPAMMAQHHYSFPVITGIDSHDSLAARRARMAVYQRFIAELDQNHQHLTDQVSEIDLSDPEDLRATMPEQGSDILAHFGEDQFMHRLQIYKAHISEWRQRYPRLKGVDLRYNGEVPLEMETDNAAAPATIASLKTAPAETAKQAASSASIAQTPTTPPISTKPAAAKANPPSATATAKSIAPPKKAPPKSSAAAHKAAEAKKRAARLRAAKLKAAHKKAAAQHIAVPKPTNASSSTTTGH